MKISHLIPPRPRVTSATRIVGKIPRLQKSPPIHTRTLITLNHSRQGYFVSKIPSLISLHRIFLCSIGINHTLSPPPPPPSVAGVQAVLLFLQKILVFPQSETRVTTHERTMIILVRNFRDKVPCNVKVMYTEKISVNRQYWISHFRTMTWMLEKKIWTSKLLCKFLLHEFYNIQNGKYLISNRSL